MCSFDFKFLLTIYLTVLLTATSALGDSNLIKDLAQAHANGDKEGLISLVDDVQSTSAEKLGFPEQMYLDLKFDLARVLSDYGELDVAFNLMDGVLEEREGLFGKDSFDLIEILDELADIEQNRGRQAQANMLRFRALMISKRTLGDTHSLIRPRLEKMVQELRST